MLIPSFSEQTMSFTNTNLVAISNGNNNNNVIAASNGDSFIAAISGLIGNEGPFTGAKFFKGAAPGTIKKPSAGVAGMKTTVGFDGFTSVDAQVSKPSSSLRNKLFLASKPKITHTPTFGSNETLQQAGKLVSDEPASKFVVPSSAHGNGGHPEHLENALAARQADNLAYVEKQRALHPAAPLPLRNEVRVTTAAPGDFPTLGGNDIMGKAGYDSSKNKKSYKDVAESGINRVGDSPKSGLGDSCLIRNGLKAYYLWNRKVPSGRPSKKWVKPY